MNIFVGPPTKAISGDTIKICSGDTIQLTGSVAYTGVPSWTRASGVTTNNIAFISNSSNDTVDVKVKTAGTFKMYYTIALGTTGAATNCFSRDSLIIKVNAAPTTATIYGPATLTACDTSTTFILNANAPAAGETASWMLPNNLGVNFISGSRHGKLTTISATSVKVSDLPQGTTIVQYAITGANGCTTLSRVSILIGANAGADITVCQGNTAVHISGSATNGWTPLWSTQSSSIASIVSGAASANVTLSITGAGKIHMVYTLIDAGKSCVSTDTMIVTALSSSECTTGIVTTKTENLNMMIYPNPSNGIINILLKDDKTSYATITVISLDGRVILAEQLGSVKDIQKEINLSNAAKGIYFIKLTKGEETTFSKVVVQ
jgi:Secretion system C-terminal sorting domain